MAKITKSQKIAQFRVSEFIKCKHDFAYYCSSYVFLELPGGDVLFDLYDKQRELADAITLEHFIAVLKSRQIGISTVIKAYSSWLCLFYDNVVVGIISKDGAEATDFSRDIRGMIEKMPDWLKPPKGVLGRGFAKRAEQSFILTNGSKVYASTVAPTAPDKTLRGKAVTFLVIDEAAFIKFLDVAWTALVPALATSQKQARKMGIPYGTVILSTPNKTVGTGKFFFERYSRAIAGGDIFKPHTIYWRDIPELANDPEWHANQCKLFDNDQKKIAQELELKFLPSEGSFFSAETVEKIQENTQEPIEKFKLFNGEVWVFSKPVPGRYYMVGIDTATEYGSDKSAITIWDYQTLAQVWEYQGKCRVTDFVKVVSVAFAQYPGVFVIESNSCGNQVVENLSDSEFSYMIYKGKRGSTRAEGIYTSAKNRPLMIDALYSYVTEYPECVKSKRLALELTALVEKPNGKVEADEGVNDDLAMATGVVFFVRKYDPPTLIDTTNVAANDLTNIIDFNTQRINMSNPDIMSVVKGGLDAGEIGGYIDILSMYNKT